MESTTKWDNKRTALKVHMKMEREAAAGAAAGVIGTILGYPLDTIKTRMQVVTKGYNVLDSSVADAIKNIHKNSGFQGFYRGVASPLGALTVLNTLNFSLYANFRTIFGVSDPLLASGRFEYRVTFASAIVGPFASIISTPFELVKTQLQLDTKEIGSKKYRGSLHATKSIFNKFGIGSLYIGHSVNTLREMVFLSVYFTTYEHLKAAICLLSQQESKISIPIAGGISGALGWFVSFPLDCIKANVQSRTIGESMKISSFQTGINLFKSRGIFGLYKGVMPSILRAFVVSSSRFSVYEAVMEYFPL